MANIPFPNTALFHEALQSAEALDESEVRQYELDPPYTPPSYPTNTSREQIHTQKMTEVFLGRQLRERRKFEDRRVRGASREVIRDEQRQEFYALLVKWESLNSYLEGYKAGPREVRMAEQLLRWRAYIIHTLASEIDEDP
jgi:hypothetical protein